MPGIFQNANDSYRFDQVLNGRIATCANLFNVSGLLLTMSNPIHAIVETQNSFVRRTGRIPRKLYLPQPIAVEILDLGIGDIGSHAKVIASEGVKALDKVFGMQVEIVAEGEVRFE